MEQNDIYEKEISIEQCILLLRKKASRILLVGIIMAVLVTGYKYIRSLLIPLEDAQNKNIETTKYMGKATIYLGNISPSETEAVKLYMTGKEMLNNTISELNLNLEYSELYNMISLENSKDVLIMINITGEDEQMIYKITDYIASTGSARIRSKFKNYNVIVLEPAYINKVDSIQVPVVTNNYIKLIKSLIKYFIIGFVIGIFLACILYLGIYIFSNTIRSSKEVKMYLGIPVLGTVPIIHGTRKSTENWKRKKRLRLSQYASKDNN